MLRWLIGGGREPQGLAEKSSVQTIGEEQIQNPYTELLVLKGHQDIVRFLVQIDDCRLIASNDGSEGWNVLEVKCLDDQDNILSLVSVNDLTFVTGSHVGFFNIWGFGRANKQANQAAKKVQENTPVYFLELVGDLIGHSSAVQRV
ncbi:wd repeat-containing protein 41 [Limosa lapponica baueri]|uniref:Wd repeat-containing protein 41 n=1 Tax=Limosa lapponica baueri TaxID=1758121 RepID=A0A2I0TVV0_LIMLA|nr:wd repeat-containing protein 41 [Limosa lapponica baueri]